MLFEPLTITMREGLEAALVVGIIFAFLSKTDRHELKKYAYAGMISAIAGSILVSMAIQMFTATWNEFTRGLILFTAAVFLAALLLWMHLVSTDIRLYMEHVFESVLGMWKEIGIFSVTFIMIFRAGAEVVLFLLAAKSSLTVLLGSAAGLALAGLFGYLFMKGSLRMDTRRFFRIPDLILPTMIIYLIIRGMFEWSEAGVIKLTHIGMKIVYPLVKEPASIAFAGIILGSMVLLYVMIPWRKVEIDGLEGIEKRKALAAIRKERNRKTVAGIIAAMLIFLFVSAQISALPAGIDPTPEKVSTSEGVIKIPVTNVNDGNLHKYECDMQHESKFCPMHGSNGTANARILAIRKSDGNVAVAFDACPICGAAGYMQEGKELICKHCGAPINPDTVDIGGGCNPVPLEYEIDGNEIVIKIENIGERADLFK